MKIVLASDHAGFELKNKIREELKNSGYETDDLGCDSSASVDYPDFAGKVARAVQAGDAERGILVCGTGIGMAISANKFSGVRAASLTELYSCEMTRRHNDLNVLCLGARVIGEGLALRLVQVFLATEFEGGRHANRLAKIEKSKT